MTQIQKGKRTTFRQIWRDRVAAARFRTEKGDMRRALSSVTNPFGSTLPAGGSKQAQVGSATERRPLGTGLEPTAVTCVDSRSPGFEPQIAPEAAQPLTSRAPVKFNSATFEIEGRTVILNVGAEHQMLDSGKSVKLLRIHSEHSLLPVAVVEINEREVELEVGKPTVNIDGVRIKLDNFPDVWDFPIARDVPGTERLNPWTYRSGGDMFGLLNPFGTPTARYGLWEGATAGWGHHFDFSRYLEPTTADRVIVAIDSAIRRASKSVRNATVGIAIYFHLTFAKVEEKHEEPEPKVGGPNPQ